MFHGLVEHHNVVEGTNGVILRRTRHILETRVNVEHCDLHEGRHESVINEQIGGAGEGAQRTDHFEHVAANVANRREEELGISENTEGYFVVLKSLVRSTHQISIDPYLRLDGCASKNLFDIQLIFASRQ